MLLTASSMQSTARSDVEKEHAARREKREKLHMDHSVTAKKFMLCKGEKGIGILAEHRGIESTVPVFSFGVETLAGREWLMFAGDREGH